MYKYDTSQIDGPSSRYTGDNGVVESKVFSGMKRWQSVIKYPQRVQSLNLYGMMPLNIAQISYYKLYVIQRII